MHKIVILIETPEDEAAFMDEWPLFLFLAERMPGLRKETSSHIGKTLFGASSYSMIHELHFDSLQALKEAMASQEGRLAGTQIQKMTRGRVVLMFADHNEDTLERFRPSQPASAPAPAVKKQDEETAQKVPEAAGEAPEEQAAPEEQTAAAEQAAPEAEAAPKQQAAPEEQTAPEEQAAVDEQDHEAAQSG